MLRIIIMTLSLIAVIIVYAAANILPFNGKTTGEIQIGYQSLYTCKLCIFNLGCYLSTARFLALWLFAQQSKH